MAGAAGLLPPAAAASGSRPVGSSPLTPGVLVAIALVGSAVLALPLGFLILCLARRRVARPSRDLTGEAAVAAPGGGGGGDDDDDDDAATTDTGRRAPSRLQKHRRPSTQSGSSSPVRPTPLPVLPPLFGRRVSFNPFSGGTTTTTATTGSAGAAHGPRAWIDEDALHGPKVAKRKVSKRRSIRESWPLRNMVPTLPRLSGLHAQGQESQRHQSPGRSRQPLGHVQESGSQEMRDQVILMAAHGGQMPPVISPRSVPAPPKPVLMVSSSRKSVRGTIYSSDDPQRQRSTLLVSPSKGGSLNKSSVRLVSKRNPSSDSSLSEILRSTEQRIQAGTTSGVAWRNQGGGGSPSKSPAKTLISAVSRDTLVGGGGGGDGGGGAWSFALDSAAPTLCHSRTPSAARSLSAQTSSPTRSVGSATPKQASSHQRNVSVSSALSENDSLYGETERAQDHRPVPDVPAGLTSPSRSCLRDPKSERRGDPDLVSDEDEQPADSTSRPHSARSSVSSALSTVYSEDETQGGGGGVARSRPAPSLSMPMGHAMSTAGPFASNPSTSSSRPTSSHAWQGWQSSTLMKPAKLRERAGVDAGFAYLQPPKDDPFQASAGAGPSQQSPSSHRARRPSTSQPLLVVITPSTTGSKGSLSPAIPGLIPGLTLLNNRLKQDQAQAIPGDDDLEATPTKPKAQPRAPEVRAQGSSPTLGQRTFGGQDMSPVPKPLAVNKADRIQDGPTLLGPSHATGGSGRLLRLPSPSSSVYSQDVSMTSSVSSYESDKTMAAMPPGPQRPLPYPTAANGRLNSLSFRLNSRVRVSPSPYPGPPPSAAAPAIPLLLATASLKKPSERPDSAIIATMAPKRSSRPDSAVTADVLSNYMARDSAGSNASGRTFTLSDDENERNDDMMHTESALKNKPSATVAHSPGRSLVPLASTVAELRRMNSTVSAYSAAESTLGGPGGVGDSPTLPAMRGGGFGPVERGACAHRSTGSRNYLSMGSAENTSSPFGSGGRMAEAARQEAGRERDERRRRMARSGANSVDLGLTLRARRHEGGEGEENRKENRKENRNEQEGSAGGVMALKMPVMDFSCHSNSNADTPDGRGRGSRGLREARPHDNVFTSPPPPLPMPMPMPMPSSAAVTRVRQSHEYDRGRARTRRMSDESLGPHGSQYEDRYDEAGFLLSSPAAPGSASRTRAVRAS